jgi:hypothetical protein
MSTPDTFKVIYNACYGGFDLSKAALAEYNRRTSKCVKFAEYISHEDPVLIQMIETMDAKEINSENSKLKIKEFPIKCKPFLTWYEYDGKESVKIDYDKYISHHVKLILDMNTSAEEKINLISDLYRDINV